MAWYQNSYRRHLCDMHISDWNSAFLAEFSPEMYVENLKKAHIKSAMIYMQSHIGLCYFPTKVGRMHSAFVNRENMMQKTGDLCHENGIDVIGYYSLNYNTIEALRHPDWRMIFPEGDSAIDRNSRYGLCCPNNPEYRSFTEQQINEALNYFHLDGVFFDMPFWPQVCHCKHCKERWSAEHGGEIPANEKDASWNDFMRLREKWMGDFSQFCTNLVKSFDNRLTVEQNYAYSVVKLDGTHSTDGYISERIRDASDYVGGDLYNDFIHASFAEKYFYSASKNQPFEYMTSRCMPTLASHTTTKSLERMLLSAFVTVAHHGANFFIDAIDPIGTLDERVYTLIGKVFEKTMPYEKYENDGHMIEKIGIYYQIEGKTNLQGQTFSGYDGAVNSCTNMIDHHVPVGIVSRATVSKIRDYEAILLSNPHFLSSEEIDMLIWYVEQGGILYFSNADETRLFEVLVGGRYAGHTQCAKTYAAPKKEYETLFEGFNQKYPLPLEYDVPMIEGIADEEILATVTLPYFFDEAYKFASIHSNPPGTPTRFPAVIKKQYGKGCVIWSAGPIEVQPIFWHKQIICNLLKNAGAALEPVSVNAPCDVEIVSFVNEEKKHILVSTYHINDTDEVKPQMPFEITYSLSSRVERVILLPECKEVPFTQENGVLAFQTRTLYIFDMYEIVLCN